mmetsp:Transcript_18756/g.32547  ORF Transcript_18756/g.32547 Transcript_18756/m.32547 type:complete len:351 (-) Transcript_18756:36-1088(-)
MMENPEAPFAVVVDDGNGFDLGNMLGWQISDFAIVEEVQQAILEKQTDLNVKLRQMTESGVEELVHKLFQLPRDHRDKHLAEGKIHGVLVKLPTPQTKLPRAKPLPKPREDTKWQKFAREKGISKKKRDRMVWDEESHTWIPRYGYKSKVSKKRNEQYNAEDDLDAHEGGKASKVPQKKIKAASVKAKRPTPLPALEGALTKAAKGNPKKPYLSKEGLSASLHAAQLSTASVGKFDQRVDGEKAPKATGKKRKFDALTEDKKTKKVSQGETTEKTRARSVMKRVLLEAQDGASTQNMNAIDKKIARLAAAKPKAKPAKRSFKSTKPSAKDDHAAKGKRIGQNSKSKKGKK